MYVYMYMYAFMYIKSVDSEPAGFLIISLSIIANRRPINRIDNALTDLRTSW